MSTELDFNDLTPIEIPVSVGGKSYVLREASGDASCRYRNAILRCMELGTDNQAKKITDLADTEPFLVSMCLFDESGNAVPIATIRKWPSRIVSKLFSKIQEISELQETQSMEAVKNDLSGMGDGSV